MIRRALVAALLAVACTALAQDGARTYPVTLVRVVDGDTQKYSFDLGFGLRMERDVRLLCVNTPEVYGESREAGLLAKAEAVNWLAVSAPLEAVLPPDAVDKYGRTLAVVRRGGAAPLLDRTSLNRYLIETGNAVEYLCPAGTVY